MKNTAPILFLLCCFCSTILGHICIINPHQRGALNVSDAGDGTCYRKNSPCGDNTPGAPVVSMVGGSEYVVKWQQNFNHYEPGYPGIMDISYSTNPNPTSDSDFTTLSVIPDFNAHMQYNQRNFSQTITVPDINCVGCVLRMRYAPNKPTESIFYQCSDINITSSSQQMESNALYGIRQNDDGEPTDFVKVDTTTGAVTSLFAIPFDVRKRSVQDGVSSINDQVTAVSDSVFWYTSASSGVIGAIPDSLVNTNGKGSWNSEYFSPAGIPMVALNYDPVTGFLIGLQLLPIPTNGQYGQFSTVWINPSTADYTPMNTTFLQDNTWVNFQWAELDSKHRIYYLLAGNENDAVGLTILLYSIDVDTGAIINQVQLDVSEYTIAGIHYDPVSDTLYALSPGLVNESYDADYQWTLVVVDPEHGMVTPKYMIAPLGKYTNYYGGDVYGTPENTRELFYVFFTTPDHHQGVIGSINLDSGKTRFVEVDDLQHIHNLASKD